MRNFSDIQKILKDNNDLDLSEIKKIYLLGSTGAGKTSLVRNIIDTVSSAFPTTTQTRTTVAPTEYVIKKGLPFKTTIILKRKDDVLDSIEMLINDAIKKALDNAKINKKNIEDIVLKLEESPDEKFRLKYMVSKETLEAKAETILSEIIPKIIDKTDDETLLDTVDIKTLKQNIIIEFLGEIEDNFKKLVNSDYQLFSNQPLIIRNIEKKSDFINRNKELLKTDIGSISLLVEYIRIEGEQLLADWLKPLNLEFLLIDGEGIGHSLTEKRDTLSIRHYDFFDYCNHIFLMEEGKNPFISGGQSAIESIFLNGYKNKFKLIFSKIDEINDTDKNRFLRRRLSNLENALNEQEIAFGLENKNTYKLEKLNQNQITSYSKREIKRLFEDMKNQEESTFIPLEYDFNDFFSNLETEEFISYFRQKIDREHWTRIKAFTKRMSDKEVEYDSIKPISEVLMFLMRDVNVFLQRDDQLNSDVINSQNKIKQELSKKLRVYIYKEFIVENSHLWNQAYLEQGKGSHKRRKNFIFKNIIHDFLPTFDDKKFIDFKQSIKKLLLDSGARELASAKRINIKAIDIHKIYKDKDFKWEVGEDTNILIGKNGTGKSTILKLIHACINKDKEVLEKFNFPAINLKIRKYYEDETFQNITISNNQNFSDVKSILVDTFDGKAQKCEKNQSDLDCKLSKLVDKFGQYQRELNQEFFKQCKKDDLNEKINIIEKNITTASLDKLKEYQELKIKENSIKETIYRDITLFKEIVDDFLLDTNKELILDDSKEPLLVKLIKENRDLSLDKISSGEKQILVIFLTILLEKSKPFILLMDEPETSLHVEWQSKLIESIKRLNNNIQIIIATHNPLLMLNRNSDEIGVIEIGEEVVNTEGKGTKYLDISAVLIRYFGLHSLVGKDMRDKVEKLFELKDKRENNNFSEEDKRQLELIENELDGTMASRFIYDRAYFKFLMFVKENNHIDFSGLKKLNKQDFNSLLDKYKAQF